MRLTSLLISSDNRALESLNISDTRIGQRPKVMSDRDPKYDYDWETDATGDPPSYCVV